MKYLHFTLIELLVVIAMISLLTSLILPALGRARESGRAAVCLSNMTQIGKGLTMYLDDNNGEFPTASEAALSGQHEWMGHFGTKWAANRTDLYASNRLLNTYIGGPYSDLGPMAVAQCPSDDVRYAEAGSSYKHNTQGQRTLREANINDIDETSLMVAFTEWGGLPYANGKGANSTVNFHPKIWSEGQCNTLFVDGHASVMRFIYANMNVPNYYVVKMDNP